MDATDQSFFKLLSSVWVFLMEFNGFFCTLAQPSLCTYFLEEFLYFVAQSHSLFGTFPQQEEYENNHSSWYFKMAFITLELTSLALTYLKVIKLV